MVMERARAKERERAIHEFRQRSRRCSCILHLCPSLDTLAGDFLCTPDLECDAWEFAPDVSTQCEKVMTFAAEQNQGCRFYHYPQRDSAGWEASAHAARGGRREQETKVVL